MNGVTFLICTYNGARRLPETLAHLAAQQVPPGLPWEVLVVSNASTDDTLGASPQLWNSLGAPAPLRVFDQPRPGKENALTLGLDEAAHENVVIVDDDNWLYPDFLGVAAALMAAHPRIGILGSCGEGAFETEKPAWFDRFQAVFAVGPQAAHEGPLLAPDAYLNGAGSVVRRSGWQHLRRQGFTFNTHIVRGKTLSCGEDVELGDALRLAGYELWYSPRLRFRHFMAHERLNWDYLLRMGRGAARSGLHNTVYYLLHREPTLELADFRRRYRRWLLWATRELLRHPGRLLTYRRHPADPAHPDVFDTMRQWLRLQNGWQRRQEAEDLFSHAKNLQRRLQANPAPLPPPAHAA